MAESEPSSTMFTHKLYDQLKWIAQILLPALGTFWFALAGIWHLSHTTEIVGTITAIDLLLGTLLKVSSTQYYNSGANFDGDVIVTPEDGGNKVTMAFNKAPEDIVDDPGKHSMELKIERKDGTGS